MEKIFLLDSGHGGIINNAYQTAPAKMFKFPNGTIAFEGVINRAVKNFVIKEGKIMGLKIVDVCPSDLDIPLLTRCQIINALANNYGKDNCLLISLHSNAGGGTGFEIWTTRGENLSDKYATLFVQRFEKKFPNTIVRKDVIDGDPDKENDFYIQKNSVCPSILPEWMFFDNWADYQIISSEFGQMQYAKMIADFCVEVNSIT